IRKQVEIAIEEASVILFVVDVTVGVTDLDESVANFLRKTDKPIYLCANKVDNSARQFDSAEFYSFGLGNLYNISAVNGAGTGELMDELVKEFTVEGAPDDESGLPKIAVVGKP